MYQVLGIQWSSEREQSHSAVSSCTDEGNYGPDTEGIQRREWSALMGVKINLQRKGWAEDHAVWRWRKERWGVQWLGGSITYGMGGLGASKQGHWKDEGQRENSCLSAEEFPLLTRTQAWRWRPLDLGSEDLQRGTEGPSDCVGVAQNQAQESPEERERARCSRRPDLGEEEGLLYQEWKEGVWNQQCGAKQGLSCFPVRESAGLPLEKATEHNTEDVLSLEMKGDGRDRKFWTNSLRGSQGWGIYLQCSCHQFSTGPSRRGRERGRAESRARRTASCLLVGMKLTGHVDVP